jgi:hypothetical protein
VGPHIDSLPGDHGAVQRALNHRLRISYKGVNRAVCGFSRVDIEQGTARRVSNGLGYGVDGLAIVAFGKIRDTFNDFSHDALALD